MSIIDSIQLSGSSYDVRDKSATTVVSLTQQEYDALPSSAKTANILYNITDATAGDLTQYWTSAQTQSAITEAVSGKQETLVSGTNIKTINNESILGSGNIDIQGGGTDTGTVQTMIDQSISGKADSSTVTALTNTVTGHTADTSIHVTTAQTAAWDAKSDFSGSYNDLTDKPTIPTVPTSNTAFTNDAGYITSSALNGYATTGDVQTATSGKVDTSTYTAYTASTDAALATKQTTLTAGTGISIVDNVISATGGSSITVDSALDSGSTNPVENQALWDELRLGGAGLVETTIEWSGSDSTNYPNGCTKIKLEFTSECDADIDFLTENDRILGNVSIQYHPQWSLVNVNTSNFQGASYEISGSTITISYPSVTNVTKLNTRIYNYATVKAIYNDPLIVLKDQVTGNTAAIKTKVDTTTFNSYASSVDSALGGKLNVSDYVIDSALNVASTNPVEGGALYDELRIENAPVETTLTFEEQYSTNYPEGCTKLKVEVVGSMNNSVMLFFNDGINIGNITINNYGSISVDTSVFQGATYEISGTTVIISYPTVTTVTRLYVGDSTKYTYKAIISSTTPLKDQVVANTTALGGLSLVKLTQAQYDALVTKDSNTLYVIVN